MPIRPILREVFNELGYQGVGDFMRGALGFKVYSAATLKGLTISTVLTSAAVYVTHFILHPPAGLVTLWVIDLANAWYGIQVARKISKEGFRFAKFKKTGGVLFATFLIMWLVRRAINDYDAYDFIATPVFGWFFSTKMQKLASKMIALKVQEEGAAGLFQRLLKSFLDSKFGDMLVDGTQRRQPVPESEPITPPADAALPDTPA